MNSSIKLFLLWKKLKIHYGCHRTPGLYHILRQSGSVILGYNLMLSYDLISCLFKVGFPVSILYSYLVVCCCVSLCQSLPTGLAVLPVHITNRLMQAVLCSTLCLLDENEVSIRTRQTVDGRSPYTSWVLNHLNRAQCQFKFPTKRRNIFLGHKTENSQMFCSCPQDGVRGNLHMPM